MSNIKVFKDGRMVNEFNYNQNSTLESLIVKSYINTIIKLGFDFIERTKA